MWQTAAIDHCSWLLQSAAAVPKGQGLSALKAARPALYVDGMLQGLKPKPQIPTGNGHQVHEALAGGGDALRSLQGGRRRRQQHQLQPRPARGLPDDICFLQRQVRY